MANDAEMTIKTLPKHPAISAHFKESLPPEHLALPRLGACGGTMGSDECSPPPYAPRRSVGKGRCVPIANGTRKPPPQLWSA
jgi:hypothetical protein